MELVWRPPDAEENLPPSSVESRSADRRDGTYKDCVICPCTFEEEVDLDNEMS